MVVSLIGGGSMSLQINKMDRPFTPQEAGDFLWEKAKFFGWEEARRMLKAENERRGYIISHEEVERRVDEALRPL
jgi:hypothetical protein